MKEDVPVFYSLGNFYFTELGSMPADYDTAIAQLVIKKDGTIESKLIPCRFSNGYIQMLTDGEDYQRILRDVASYSEGVYINNEGYITSY